MPSKTEQPALLNHSELAKALGVSRTTLYRMEAAGAPFRFGRSRVDWITDWLKSSPEPTKPPATGQSIEDLLRGPQAPTSRLADIAFHAMFLLAVKAAAPLGDQDKLTPGEWQGRPALFAYNTPKTFAFVFDESGKPLGFWNEANKQTKPSTK